MRWASVSVSLRTHTPLITDGTKHSRIFPSVASTLAGGRASWTQKLRKHSPPTENKGFSDVNGPIQPLPLPFLPADLQSSTTGKQPVERAASLAARPVEMTRDQKVVFDLALDGASLFIGGEAGTGKSFLLTAIAAALTQKGLRVAVTASTGIAALNIGGNTFHSEFGIPTPTPDDLVDAPLPSGRGSAPATDGDEEEVGEESVATGADVDDSFADAPSDSSASAPFRVPRRLQFKNTAALASVDVIVLDEVSMLHAGFLETLERVLRQTAGRDSRRPFGGVQLILSGDFMQLTPFASVGGVFSGSRQLLQTRTGDAAHCNRKTCSGIQRTISESPKGEKETTKYAHESQETSQGSKAAASTGSFQASSHSAPGRTQSQKHRPRRQTELWYYDKLMFESWCFCRHLLHVQLREPQRQEDAVFAADLNALRRGELPFRLSRAAHLNPVDDDAVRLLPTKAAVKNFNDRRMLELKGESRVFRTQLTMTDAASAAELACARNSSGKTRSCHSTLLVHYRLCMLSKDGHAATFARNRRLSSQELRAAERQLERRCRLPAHSVQLRALPVPLSYSSSLSTLCLECAAATKKAADARRAVVRAALEECAAQQHSQTSCEAVPRRSGKRAAYTTAPCMLSSASLFTREIVRVEPIEWSQLLRRLQPAMQQDFRDAIRRHTLLQDKTLKQGCRVMLLRNLSATHVNGSLGTITRYLPASQCDSLMPADLKATIAQQGTAVLPIVQMDVDGAEVAIPWIVLPVPVVHKDWCYVLRATCMPLTPAYAFTVHKIQGVTLDHSVLFDADGMFPCDHLVYVAASRVRRFEQLRIVNLTPGMISVHVPSLDFSTHIPSVDCARQTWVEWRRKPNSTTFLFLPSYVKTRK